MARPVTGQAESPNFGGIEKSIFGHAQAAKPGIGHGFAEDSNPRTKLRAVGRPSLGRPIFRHLILNANVKKP